MVIHLENLERRGTNRILQRFFRHVHKGHSDECHENGNLRYLQKVDKNKVWVKFWRENSKPLVKAAKANALALEGTGQLAKSVGFFQSKASRRSMLHCT